MTHPMKELLVSPLKKAKVQFRPTCQCRWVLLHRIIPDESICSHQSFRIRLHFQLNGSFNMNYQPQGYHTPKIWIKWLYANSNTILLGTFFGTNKGTILHEWVCPQEAHCFLQNSIVIHLCHANRWYSGIVEWIEVEKYETSTYHETDIEHSHSSDRTVHKMVLIIKYSTHF